MMDFQAMKSKYQRRQEEFQELADDISKLLLARALGRLWELEEDYLDQKLDAMRHIEEEQEFYLLTLIPEQKKVVEELRLNCGSYVGEVDEAWFDQQMRITGEEQVLESMLLRLAELRPGIPIGELVA